MQAGLIRKGGVRSPGGVLQVWGSPAMRLQQCHSSRSQQPTTLQQQEPQYPQKLLQVPLHAVSHRTWHLIPTAFSWLGTSDSWCSKSWTTLPCQ